MNRYFRHVRMDQIDLAPAFLLAGIGTALLALGRIIQLGTRTALDPDA